MLTEAWAAEYLEVVITLLVFALGIPTLILQLAAPEETRVVLSQQLKLVRRLTWAIGFVTLLGALTFVWLLHPFSSIDNSASALDGGHITANTVMTLVMLAVFFTVLLQIRGYRRDGLVRYLHGQCKKSISKSGTLGERSLVDLVYLGEQGDPGRAKTQVIEVFNELAAQVQGREKYAGEGLADLIHGIENTLVGGPKQGNLKNFEDATITLERVLLRLGDKGLSVAPDAANALSTLERLGVAALKLDSGRAAIAALQVVASAAEGQSGASQFASERLFNIGMSALGDGRHYLIAIAALNKLEALADQSAPIQGEMAADLLGLLAHFWTNGDTARRHARIVLARMDSRFTPSLEQCLQAAIEHQYRTAHFDTADKLGEMLRGLVSQPV